MPEYQLIASEDRDINDGENYKKTILPTNKNILRKNLFKIISSIILLILFVLIYICLNKHNNKNINKNSNNFMTYNATINNELKTTKKKEVPHAPEVSPMEIENFLLKHHSNPSLWFHGQLINYVWRENEETKNVTNQIVMDIPFECGKIIFEHGFLCKYIRMCKALV
uniref:FUT8_N_cat domain-containing protein n=1 Tax=Meloidogyne hapla TaxID=6305 RepID=A0A1I8BWK1_MELHA